MSVQPGGENARIVQDQAVARPDELREIAKQAIFPISLVAIHDEHPRAGTIGQRLLRDALFRQVIIEVRKLHQSGKRASCLSSSHNSGLYSTGAEASPYFSRISCTRARSRSL